MAKHKKHKKYLSRGTLQNFFALSLISLAFVSGLSVLSRAEMRLSGEILAAEPSDLKFLFMQDPLPTVRKVADREDVRLYLLEGKHHYLVYAHQVLGEWEVTKVEKVHR